MFRLRANFRQGAVAAARQTCRKAEATGSIQTNRGWVKTIAHIASLSGATVWSPISCEDIQARRLVGLRIQEVNPFFPVDQDARPNLAVGGVVPIEEQIQLI